MLLADTLTVRTVFEVKACVLPAVWPSLVTGQMERQVGSTADVISSPHLLMAAPSASAAAARGEELTRRGWARHAGPCVPAGRARSQL